jgi:small subunit ribosomal protein S15
MAVTKEQTADIIKKFQRKDLDTGSPEVQSALLTARINEMTSHFTTHKKDKHGVRGLVRCVNQRRKLLDYLKRTDKKSYLETIKKLNLSK